MKEKDKEAEMRTVETEVIGLRQREGELLDLLDELRSGKSKAEEEVVYLRN